MNVGFFRFSFLFAIFFIALLFPIKRTSADVPLAARLLAEPYTSTGVRVTVSNFSNLRGLANDGTTVYMLNSSGNIMTLALSPLAALSAGSSTSTTGTIHTVSWGSGGAPSTPDLGNLSLAYSHGCLWITDGTNSAGSIRLYCIDTSDYTVTNITVPSDKPLPVGAYYVYSSLIDFPDGRIGKVSSYTNNGDGTYRSTLRTYTITGTGKNASIAWSQDYIMSDSSNFAVDEHGIATDGTYLYRIQWKDYNPNYKSWTLSNSATSTVTTSGQYTMPFDNMHFLSHNHTSNYYLVGHWDNQHFFITSTADPGPGPGNPLTPTFATASSTTDGFTVQVSNYDSSFTWTATTSEGSVSINGSGLVTVSGVSEYQRATTTVSTQKTGIPNGSASVSAISLDLPPTFSSLSATSGSSTTGTVTWTTNKSASTKVSYSVDTNYASSTSETDTSSRVTSHSSSLSNLIACTTYNYKAISADSAGTYATSTASSFTTIGCSGGATPTVSTSTTVTVSSAATSTVTSSGRTFVVSTPANFTATSSSVVIQIKGLASDTVLGSISKPTSALSSAASVVFDVTALINNTTVLDSFDTAVTISYTYTDTDISGLNESSLKMYHYHNNSWLELDNCSVNTSTNTITCTAPSFSVFAIFGSSTSGGGLPPAAYNKPVIPNGGFNLSAIKNSDTTYTITSNAGVDVKYIALSTNQDFKNTPQLPYSKSISWNPCPTKSSCSTVPTIIYAKFYTAWGQQSEVISINLDPNQKQTSITCPYFTQYVTQGNVNSEVKKIKQFLNSYQNAKLTISNTYDSKLTQAIKNFQITYSDQILKPWGFTKPTGRWYQSTMKTANDLLGCKAGVTLDNGTVLP